MPLFGLGAGDVGQPFKMQIKHAEFDRAFDQPRGFIHKLLLVRDERKQHAHGQRVGLEGPRPGQSIGTGSRGSALLPTHACNADIRPAIGARS